MAEVGQALEEGNALRATAAHNLNEASSRSHALFTLHMELRKRPDAAQGHKYLRCKLHLVDLAGAASAPASATASARADADPVRCQDTRHHAWASVSVPSTSGPSAEACPSAAAELLRAPIVQQQQQQLLTNPDMAASHALCPVAELLLAVLRRLSRLPVQVVSGQRRPAPRGRPLRRASTSTRASAPWAT